MPRVRYGRNVSIIFRLTTPSGQRIDQALSDAPLQFCYGEQQLIAGLEAHLEGLCIGDVVEVDLPPDVFGAPGDAWTVPTSGFDIKPGMILWAERSGALQLVKVCQVHAGEATVAAEDPLAGIQMTAWIKVLSIEDEP